MRRVSRQENAELFPLAIGGYGLFGVIACYRPVSDEAPAADVPDGATPDSDTPRDEDAVETTPNRELGAEDWQRLLLLLAHVDKGRAFDEYARFYRSTSGQHYDSDALQMGRHIDSYHPAIDRHLGCRGSEMITEAYVPRARLPDFMRACAHEFRAHDTDVVYGTVRLIRRDRETFLAWARQDWACVIFNLHVEHTPEGIERAGEAFRRLIDRAIERGGSYYLTYHRFATRAQVEACYPQMRAFLRLKAAWDPHELFRSDWYRHQRALLAAGAVERCRLSA